jgi:acetate kinase
MPTQNKFAVLVINSGSSSVKFTLYQMPEETILASGVVERIGLESSGLAYQNNRGDIHRRPASGENVEAAIAELIGFLTHAEFGVIKSKQMISAVGHRVVHGGESISAPTIIDDAVKQIIAENSQLAPLHNPSNLKSIQACEMLFPGIPHVAVFDTAFHATLPEHAYLYGLPYAMYKDQGIRRYGFHGTSHEFVARETAAYLNRPLAELKLITCHLGNGSSVTAVKGGSSIDTSMGFTPLEGTLMGTRCGSIDPAILIHMMTRLKMQPHQIDHLLNKESGFLGLAGIGSSDVRDVISAMQNNNPRAAAAIEMYVYQVRKYIGAYIAALNGVDAIVFTAGIGENSPVIREMVCNGGDGMDKLGIILDTEKNMLSPLPTPEIQSDNSSVKILVIPTDEELEIARQTHALWQQRQSIEVIYFI